MAYVFTPDLETKNALIDSEHKQLIKAINDLLEACSKGQGRAQVAQTAKFVYDYTSKHFADEERLQLQYKYPDYPNHKRYHEAFKKSILDIMKKLDQQGATVAMVSEINLTLAGWLTNHIKREDKKLAAFIRGEK
ncbi:bacteriohemerythrin [Anaerotignum faecicola]|nr:bacteriohemerythrin [Anaerotignum faecicola]